MRPALKPTMSNELENTSQRAVPGESKTKEENAAAVAANSRRKGRRDLAISTSKWAGRRCSASDKPITDTDYGFNAIAAGV